MAYQIYAGSTSQTVRFFVQDTSSTAGAGLTGLTHSSSGLTCYYSKGIGAATSITLASQTATGAYTSGGFCAVDGTNMPGLYRLDLPDAVVDTEAEVIVMLRGAANMAPVAIRITAKKLQANAVTVADKTGYTLTVTPPTAATIADAVLDELVTQHLTPNSLGWNINIIKKANTVIEGTILASPTPTTTVFRISGADYPTGALEHAVLWMNSGTAQEQNSPILTTVNNGDGTITVTLEEALVTAPVAGDTVLIDPTSHVHAIADIQNGLATAAALATLTGYVDTEVAAIKVVTDRINTGLVADGAVWQFTVNMLELAPAGGGGGAGDASQATLLEVQDTVESIAASLSGVPITATGRIADGGSITLYCGDDLRVRSGSQITITVTDVGGSIYTRLDGIGEANLFWGASRRGLPASAISGSIASLSQSGSGASQTMTIVVEIDNAGASLQPAEDYTWQIESQQDYGTETDSLIEMEGVLSLRRRVV
jgi:hypothetical protein